MNPWAVSDLEEFLFFCCPECDFKKKNIDEFLNHAINIHPDSKVHMTTFHSNISELSQCVKKEEASEIDIVEDFEQFSAKIDTNKDFNVSERAQIKECFVKLDKIEVTKEMLNNCHVIPPKKTIEGTLKDEGNQAAKKFVKLTFVPFPRESDNKMVGEMTESSLKTVQNKTEEENISIDVGEEFDRDIMDTSCDSESDEENLEYNSIITNTMPNKASKKPLMCQQCTVCSRKYFSQSRFDGHKCFPLPPVKKKRVKRNHPKEKFMCQKCGKCFTTKQTLEKHEEKSHQESDEPIQCKMCSYVTNKNMLMDLHEKKFHKMNGNFCCEICGHKFASFIGVTRHKKFRHVTNEQLSEMPCHCHKCEEKFDNSVDLNDHLKYCLADADKKNLKCCFCKSANWLSNIAVERHSVEDHQSLSKVCHICDAVLSMITIGRHIKGVHQEKKFKCSECEKTFKYHRSITLHKLKVHNDTSVTHHSCKYCDKKFVQKKRLDDHVNLKHTKKHSYKCPQCNYTTLMKDGIKEHIKVVHEKRIVAVCPYGCGKEFTKKAWVYQNHLKKCDLKLKS